MKRIFNLVAAIATLSAGATLSAQDWYAQSQRELLHQQYLSPTEHAALHRGMSYDPSYGRYPVNAPYGVGYGAGYGAGSGLGMPAYPSNYGYNVPGYNTSACSRSRNQYRWMPTQYRAPVANGWRQW